MLKDAKIIFSEVDYTNRVINNPFSYHILKSIQFNSCLKIESIFDLCDIIQKQQKELEKLHQNNVVTQYFVSTEKEIERIKKEVEGC